MPLPDSSQLKTWQRYGLALAFSAVALLIQQWVFTLGGNRFMFFFVAVLLSGWCGGFGPGLMTGLIGGVAALLWLHPNGPMVITPVGEPLVLTLYVVVCIILAAACEVAHRARARLRLSVADLQQEVLRREKATKAEAEAQAEFNAFFQLAGIGMAIMQATTGRFLRVNPELCRLLGYDEQELLKLGCLEITAPEEHDRLRTEFDRFSRGDTKMMHWESRCISKRGAVIWLEVIGTDLPVAVGAERRVVSILLDINERRRAEDQVLEADRRKDEYLAMLSHELRNPLGAIRQALRLTDGEMDASTQQWAREVVERQSAQLARMVDDLLDVARFQAGKIKLVWEPLDLASVLDQAGVVLQPLFAERGHSFVHQYPRDLWVKGDAVRLEQVVVNLLTNAAKYTDWGGRIELSAGRDGEDMILNVRDNGQGMAPERIAQMFEVFVQGERSLARPEGGLGLGLAIARQLAVMHGGHLRAESPGPGKGSVFTVTLPACERPAEVPPAAARPPAARDLSAQRILVVDDHQDAARTLARLLERRGAAVAVVHDGLSALHETSAFRPDAVLLDLGLPGCDGYEVARRIRAGGDSAVKLIAVSGYGTDQDRAQSKAVGFNSHLVKPVDFEQLCGVLTAPLPTADGQPQSHRAVAAQEPSA